MASYQRIACLAVISTLFLAGCAADGEPDRAPSSPTGERAGAEPGLGDLSLDEAVSGRTVLVVGDTLALTLGDGMAEVAQGTDVTIINAANDGCGILLPVEQRSNGVLGPTDPKCNEWPVSWPALIAQHNPDVVYLTTSYWDATQQVIEPGTAPGSFNDPVFQDRWLQNAQQAIDILSANGAVVFLDDANSNNLAGVQARAVEAAAPGTADLIELREQMCSETECPATIDGVKVRDEAGNPAGESRNRLARWILNQMTER